MREPRSLRRRSPVRMKGGGLFLVEGPVDRGLDIHRCARWRTFVCWLVCLVGGLIGLLILSLEVPTSYHIHHSLFVLSVRLPYIAHLLWYIRVCDSHQHSTAFLPKSPVVDPEEPRTCRLGRMERRRTQRKQTRQTKTRKDIKMDQRQKPSTDFPPKPSLFLRKPQHSDEAPLSFPSLFHSSASSYELGRSLNMHTFGFPLHHHYTLPLLCSILPSPPIVIDQEYTSGNRDMIFCGGKQTVDVILLSGRTCVVNKLRFLYVVMLTVIVCL